MSGHSERALALVWPDAPHIDRGLLAWFADVDPGGDPAWQGEALRAIAIAALRHRRIAAQDGVQECLLWIFEQPEEFRAHSAKGRHRGYMARLFYNKIVDALRKQHGDRRVTDEDGNRRRVYDPEPVLFSALVRALSRDGDVSESEALDRVLPLSPSAEEAALSAPPAEELADVGGPDAELLRLRGEGWSSSKLADEFGATPAGVRKRLQRARAAKVAVLTFRAPGE